MHRGHTGVARLAFRSGASVIPVGMIGTDDVQPIDSKMPKFGRSVTIRFGEPIDSSRYGTRVDDHLALRELTDEVMYEIGELSGYEYVDTYATKKTEDLSSEEAHLATLADVRQPSTAAS
jgi:1-acyl-sn-glycerol-3-phosphate acyltransferase